MDAGHDIVAIQPSRARVLLKGNVALVARRVLVACSSRARTRLEPSSLQLESRFTLDLQQ